MSKLQVVVGGQFGSEAKGHVAAKLAEKAQQEGNHVTGVRVAGPNAGHSAYDAQGRKWALRTIPVMGVTNLDAQLVIAAGSEIQLSVLTEEIAMLEAAGIPISNRLSIDPQATVLTQEHIQRETEKSMHQRLGSTGKGVGAARADRIMRAAPLWETVAHHFPAIQTCDTATFLAANLKVSNLTVILEGTQGYGLGLHAGFYPYCTSSDCRAIDFLAMAGINPWQAGVDLETWVVMRTFPIRVAGISGPLHQEVTWDQLAEESGGYIQPEFTTVTKKMRRVGRWDAELAQKAVEANGVDTVRIAMMFLDYLQPSLAGSYDEDDFTEETTQWLQQAQQDCLGRPVSYAGTGPNTGVWD